MDNQTPQIAVAIRAFGNSKMQEGMRVMKGTRFAVGNPQGDLKVITVARYKQLFFAGHVRPFGEADLAAAPPRAVEAEVGEQIEANRKPEPVKPITTESIKRPSQRAAAVREAAVRRTQDPEPPAPNRLENPATPPAQPAPVGSPNGAPAPASSSPADQASNTSKPSSRPRGRRRA